MGPNVFKTVSYSSSFHLSYSAFSQIICYTNSLTFQDLLFSKTYIFDIVPGKFDDNRPISTPALFFPNGWDLSMSLTDNLYFISFSENSIGTSSVSSFSFNFHTLDKKTVSSRILFMAIQTPIHFSTFSFKYFTSLFSSTICHFFSSLSASISSNFSLMNFMDLFTSS